MLDKCTMTGYCIHTHTHILSRIQQKEEKKKKRKRKREKKERKKKQIYLIIYTLTTYYSHVRTYTKIKCHLTIGMFKLLSIGQIKKNIYNNSVFCFFFFFSILILFYEHHKKVLVCTNFLFCIKVNMFLLFCLFRSFLSACI